MDAIEIQGNSEHGLRNAGGVINRPAGAQGWHLAGASGLRLGEGGSVSVTPPLPSVERKCGHQAGRRPAQWRAPPTALATTVPTHTLLKNKKFPFMRKGDVRRGEKPLGKGSKVPVLVKIAL